MKSVLLELFLPSLIVTLLAAGCLTAILRKNGFHVLFGLVLLGIGITVLSAELNAHSGQAEGVLLTIALVFMIALQAMAGFALMHWRGKATGSVDLD